MPRFLCLCCLAVGLLAIGCGEEDTSTTPQPISSEYFPNSVGTQWKYAVYDSVRDVADTITVTVADTVTLIGVNRVASIWTFEPSGRSQDIWLGNFFDTLYVVAPEPDDGPVGQDTVIAYGWPDPPTPFIMYILPLAIDQCWDCDDCNDIVDSTCVTEIRTITTPSGTYIDVFRLRELYNCGDECGGQYISWLKPGVGIVRALRVEHDIMDYPGGPQLIASWQLLEFRPAP